MVVPAQILPHLYVGSERDALNLALLDSLQISHILCVKSSPLFTHGRKYLHVPLANSGESDLLEALPLCIDFIEDAKAHGGTVLLHCAMGMNRSPAIAAGYLIRSEKFSLEEALEHIANRRRIQIDENYIIQLERFAP